ncbi:WD repeat-containing protein 18 [Anopheles bellator]|uniref:WD repeat-containing protein 18 n=1 Tax=Anopheles bellator TaxID=139047 RepID=UPI002649E0D5|nr:WD repeat-containing protein 18 [Anopheles bellator]XP_058059296.1 WD repeat-containing protein 18 [Anopheles bellator]
MTDSVEIAFTCDSAMSCTAFDVRTSTRLIAYRDGGILGPKTLNIINNRYVVAGESNKPLLRIWRINSQEPAPVKYILPGCPNTLAVSPDGNYFAVGIKHKFFIYGMLTGAKMATLAYHYGDLVALKFTDDGSHLVSAASDCRIAVWNVARLIQGKEEDARLYQFTDSMLPITDIYVGKGGMRALLGTTSLDRSCTLYNLASGTLLLKLVYPNPLSVLTLNSLETELFVGDRKGAIYVCDLRSLPRQTEIHITPETLSVNTLHGHQKSATCLSVSVDNETLLSGGDDGLVVLWHIPTRQQLKVLPHKGPVTNAFFSCNTRLMFDQSFTNSVPYPPLLKDDNSLKNQGREEVVVEHSVAQSAGPLQSEHLPVVSDMSEKFEAKSECSAIEDYPNELLKLRKEIDHLKKINKMMFDHIIDKFQLFEEE